MNTHAKLYPAQRGHALKLASFGTYMHSLVICLKFDLQTVVLTRSLTHSHDCFPLLAAADVLSLGRCLIGRASVWGRAWAIPQVINRRPFLTLENFKTPYQGFVQVVWIRALSGGLFYPLEHYFIDVLGEAFPGERLC